MVTKWRQTLIREINGNQIVDRSLHFCDLCLNAIHGVNQMDFSRAVADYHQIAWKWEIKDINNSLELMAISQMVANLWP